ncbi:MAG: B12-binding domain-containing radical SAM protein [Deltaproteobacteria bacterium]|nr:B12-binding domain-containing radical SAM protein [Deltaproteobacteria bacterium]
MLPAPCPEVVRLAKVLLLNPPHPEGKGFTREGRCTQEAGVWATQWPPVTLATAAAFLERDGHRLKVIDCPATGFSNVALDGLVKRFQPDFAFWGTATPTLNADLDLGRSIKAAAPHVITGVFGTHVTALPESALSRPWIDMVIRREPEQTIREICLDRNRRWGEISGLSFRNGNTHGIRHTPDMAFLEPNAIPAPAWRHLDLSPYRLPLRGTPFLIVAPIRGCPYACSFCTAPLYYGRRLRKRPVAKVIDEIADNMSRFNVRDVFIWADTFTADRAYVKAFSCEILNRGLRISWTCNSRVDTVDREMLWLMKTAGLWMISFGLESGNPHVLQQAGKGISVDQSRRAVVMAHELGIRTSGHFVLGLPGETERAMRQTLCLALDLPLDIAQFYAAAPFPGTRLYDLASKEGWIRKDGLFAQDHAGMDLPGLPGHRVEEFRRYAYKRFYGRPGALLRLLTLTKPSAVHHMIRNMPRFLGWVR